MKKFLSLTLSLALLACYSCSNSGDAQDARQYVVNGIAGDEYQDGDSVLMVDLMKGGARLGAAAVKDGKFQITGIADTTYYAGIGPMNGRRKAIFLIEPGTIQLSLIDGSAIGTPLNDDLQAFADKMTEFESEEEYKDYGLRLYNAHKNDLLGYIVFEEFKDFLSYDEMKSMLQEAMPCIKNDIKNEATLKNKEKQAALARENKYIDVFGSSMSAVKVNGKRVASDARLAISDVLAEGKPVLVDFWASWCGPCRREIPVIAEVAKKYSGKFNVVGVAVWERTPDDTRKAMGELPISWPVIYNQDGADAYGIEGIPFIMLIAPDGKILGTNLRGDAIEAAVKAAL